MGVMTFHPKRSFSIIFNIERKHERLISKDIEGKDERVMNDFMSGARN